MSEYEIHYAGEWAALYEDGTLVRVGDAYRTEEEAFERLGVSQIHDEAFMRGQDEREGVAKTLEEVEEYKQKRDAARAEAERLRTEAERLLEMAKELEASNS